MNDLELIDTIVRCLNHGYTNSCESCFYNGKDLCSNIMMQDAVSVMKMQHDALKGFSEELEKLKEENARLRTMAKFSFDERKLVEAVNDIIRDCYFADLKVFDDECSYVQMLNTLIRFGEMLPSKYKVLITGFKNAPKLVKQ